MKHNFMKTSALTNDLVEKLKDNITLQAKNYLSEFDEFYPFGAVITLNGELKPTSVYFNEEFPTKESVLKNLENALKKDVENNTYSAVAIGVDVLTIPPGMAEKMDAIEIRVNLKNSFKINFYIPYKKLGSGKYKYYEAFSNDGTLSLW